ncbi:Lrp/AsnC family transcriptional regulator [Alkalicoccobacillus murimartini]|uniref:Lrp/AsnC family transcriptional regulator for asnA, asnC and gidA n=1 Tax=Alkalicoccobacillus murimartini TaxID=171685 RepID=A0ABT9YG02_9BACI|nr:Lrp/AsnC family transcriptional regulator [Alkalicoccobacillus murimartini]MDQ0206783.1 Lrp/AsnC family transcriptional regulator for asnA, asnC and gidA [Alkalicoccobacillus murimartini]
MGGIDALDRAILMHLQMNGKSAFTKIADNLHISEGTVRTRVKKMLNNKYFQFNIHMDPTSLGLEVQVIMWIKTQLGCQDQVAEALRQQSEVRFVAAFSGQYDLIVQAYFKNKHDLITFVNQQLSSIEGIISSDLSVELKQYKDSFSYITDS